MGMRAARKAAVSVIVGQDESMSGHVTGTPTRSLRLHLRGGVAPGDIFRARVGCRASRRLCPPAVVRRRDRRRADGDARWAEGVSMVGAGRAASDPAASAGGHFTWMPTHSLHARGAVAPGDHFRMAEVGGLRAARRFGTRTNLVSAPVVAAPVEKKNTLPKPKTPKLAKKNKSRLPRRQKKAFRRPLTNKRGTAYTYDSDGKRVKKQSVARTIKACH